ncbi:serine/threonine protein phosphatase [Chromatiales bacterium (ex Bugula neritina AB1)]|nr:serine/threonine protein phosphatase [Chromatiales bacterium (ex Bugula neritina AB1)]
MNNQIYAIGDIHGELEQLHAAIAKIEKDSGPAARIVFLGDYIDRGAQSRQVIEYLSDGLAAGNDWICLMGNHDRMLTLFMEDYPRTDIRFRVNYHWLHKRLGGRETLASYGVEIDDNDTILSVHTRARAAVPQAHIDFIKSLQYHYEQDDLLFVHAGIRPGVPLDQQDHNDLIWIRDEFHDDTRTHPRLVIHGHTPVPEATHYGNRVNLDTGSGYGKPLTTAVFEGTNCWLLTETGRVPLLPDFLV